MKKDNAIMTKTKKKKNECVEILNLCNLRSKNPPLIIEAVQLSKHKDGEKTGGNKYKFSQKTR
jgi:hypothetical protein